MAMAIPGAEEGRDCYLSGGHVRPCQVKEDFSRQHAPEVADTWDNKPFCGYRRP